MAFNEHGQRKDFTLDVYNIAMTRGTAKVGEISSISSLDSLLCLSVKVFTRGVTLKYDLLIVELDNLDLKLFSVVGPVYLMVAKKSRV